MKEILTIGCEQNLVVHNTTQNLYYMWLSRIRFGRIEILYCPSVLFRAHSTK